ncbi:MAG TPA: hypothetical protein PK530_21995 [Anaerolineales bacterium]|nr:hypothetical protein [Anaerolineales bacterium]
MASMEMVHVLMSGIGTVLYRPHLYLDPGSGSFILQLLLASLVGIGFFFRGFWAKLFSKFRKPKADDTTEEENENGGNE